MRRYRLLSIVWVVVALIIGFLVGRMHMPVREEPPLLKKRGWVEQKAPRQDSTTPSLPTPEPVQMVKPVYPETAREKGIQGTVFVRVLVDTTGSVRETEVFKSAHPELDSAAVRAIRQWEFSPSRYMDRPVPQYVCVPIRFALEDE